MEGKLEYRYYELNTVSPKAISKPRKLNMLVEYKNIFVCKCVCVCRGGGGGGVYEH